jgi:hypothetical protein
MPPVISNVRLTFDPGLEGTRCSIMAENVRLREWASTVVSDPEKRQARVRKANVVEISCSTLAGVCAFVAIWGFTSSSTILGGIRSVSIGGVAVLCFSALMFIAAGAGIEKRFIALISELESRG